MEIIKQTVKYGIVGVLNTLLSLAVIWLMTKKMDCSEALSNFVGYAVGLINSFFLNRKWTFRSNSKILGSAIRFFIVFVVCYLIQLSVLLLLNQNCPNDPPLYSFFEPVLHFFRIDTLFYIQIISMIVFTIINFGVNKYYTFKK